MRDRVIVVSYSVCLSVCPPDCESVLPNNIWELTPLQPLKYAPNGRRPNFIGFKCADFLSKAAVSEKKRVNPWPIEFVHVLSRVLVANA